VNRCALWAGWAPPGTTSGGDGVKLRSPYFRKGTLHVGCKVRVGPGDVIATGIGTQRNTLRPVVNPNRDLRFTSL
jgi:hypothetical protein